jgi:hypothetical protein
MQQKRRFSETAHQKWLVGIGRKVSVPNGNVKSSGSLIEQRSKCWLVRTPAQNTETNKHPSSHFIAVCPAHSSDSICCPLQNQFNSSPLPRSLNAPGFLSATVGVPSCSLAPLNIWRLSLYLATRMCPQSMTFRSGCVIGIIFCGWHFWHKKSESLQLHMRRTHKITPTIPTT